MIYTINAGDAYGPSSYWVLSHSELFDIEALFSEFEKLEIRIVEKPHRFVKTETFIEWLVSNHGFQQVETIDLFTEN